MSFIPLSIKTNNLFSSEASLKYFLIQVLASRILLFTVITFFFIENIKINKQVILNVIISSTLILKRGVAPFHFWFPNVIEGLNWINNFILITWQKIAPFIILSLTLNFYLIIITIFFSIIFGAINGLNQTSLRKLIAYSSINHLGWILASILNNENIWKIYFLFYSILSFIVIYLFKNLIIFNLNQIFSILFKNHLIKFFICLPLLSLGGLPPFLGFFPKWIVIELLIFNNFYILIFFIINFSLITLYFYIRICFSNLILNFNKINFNIFLFLKIKNIKKIFLINFISIFGLLFINFILI